MQSMIHNTQSTINAINIAISLTKLISNYYVFEGFHVTYCVPGDNDRQCERYRPLHLLNNNIRILNIYTNFERHENSNTYKSATIYYHNN